MTRTTGLIAALDTQSPQQAQAWAKAVGPSAGAVKLGMEFAYAAGFQAVADVAGTTPLFLDLKLHDIPNTVGAAIRALSYLRPKMLTVHASGGRAMMEAARKARDDAFPANDRPALLAVTVLTSLDDAALAETGVGDGARAQVLRLGKLAMQSGMDGLVCSAHEIAPLRDSLGDAPLLVTPGIRPAGSQAGDQKRVMTPAEARNAGADWIVVGRPITQAENPAAAAAAILAELTA
ncbi:orotidine 5'-phosphate decarboxylase [Acetobacter indonesiensis NRIC 0313]|uniref:Orotidine 5'-phosphate decarboxylase n=1 Tax=Acetobacter indonesiensis TaxID=104101 RepID=A0A6N3T5T9_9PROT|nr:orotidine-5'-phosphate decarboxylase [Acetobacter indonesiensis]GAN64415.1 orotidine 5'-phosphate decarboxylase [Acetobacter indonesiensis]GBQ60908.1 orotidine 5'-phosphate decarboxylase [Acetobacter indonesiensis NRIC 0313]GEN04572.1 orotidine 5'-phosphate decarboxylase [Acetobacter indonesiensis]